MCVLPLVRFPARRAEFQREAVRVIRGNRRTLTELQLGQRRKSSALSVSTIHTILHHGRFVLPLVSLLLISS